MNAQVTKTEFAIQLITIRSSRSFDDVTGKIERLFQRYDTNKINELVAAGDAEKLAAYAKQIGEPTGFAIFYQLDMGSMMKLFGITNQSRFYLFGSASTGRELFRYSGTAGLGAPTRFCVSQRDGEETRIDVNLPSLFFRQFPELNASPIPAELDARMIPLLVDFAK
jgi:uncharacterized protein (DUF302 family)